MNCKAILRKSERAGEQCRWQATRAGWCKVHDPMIVVPRLERKRDRLKAQLEKVDAEIAAASEPEDGVHAPS